jgi:N-acetylneuraminate synthase
MSSPVFVIAEAGVNHNGSLDWAKELIDVASSAGADAVKFQTFRSESVISRGARKAQYQLTNTGDGESQLEMVKRLELDLDAHRTLIAHAKSQDILFLSTPFDLESVQVLSDVLDLAQLKIASGELTNLPLLLAAARTRKPLIVSTGMCTLGEVEQALAAIAWAGVATADATPTEAARMEAFRSAGGQEFLRERVSLLHCTTEYPAPAEDVNLRAMSALRAAFGLPVGYSDHTRGVHVSIAAVALGASIIEKHVTLDRSMPGPDHIASLEPAELIALVSGIRDIERALGSGLKIPAPSELKNIDIARKSLVASVPIRRGERFDANNLTTKRPGQGITAMRYYDFLNRVAARDYAADELIDES